VIDTWGQERSGPHVAGKLLDMSARRIRLPVVNIAKLS